MKYLEIDSQMPAFDRVTLEKIFLRIKPFSQMYSWSIQIIEGVGNIEDVLGMNMLQLEKYCDDSDQGYAIDFDLLIKFVESCDDIIEIVITGCCSQNQTPKAFKDKEWEKKCEVIISREDSYFWQLYSSNKDIMAEFQAIAA